MEEEEPGWYREIKVTDGYIPNRLLNHKKNTLRKYFITLLHLKSRVSKHFINLYIGQKGGLRIKIQKQG